MPKTYSPTLRGEIIDGHDKSAVSFGSAEDWLRAYGAMDTVRFSIVAAVNGRPCRFRERRGSIWSLERYEPRRPATEGRAA
jgi:hypothetical protein